MGFIPCLCGIVQRERNERWDNQAKQHNLHVIDHVPSTCVCVALLWNRLHSVLHMLVTAPPISRATLFGMDSDVPNSTPESEQLVNSESGSDSHAVRRVEDLMSMFGVLVVPLQIALPACVCVPSHAPL